MPILQSNPDDEEEISGGMADFRVYTEFELYL